MNVHQSNLMRGMMLIGGELVPSEGGEWLESVNPANEETLGHVPHGTANDVNRAVAAAEAAHPAWAALEPKERAKLVKKLAAKLRGLALLAARRSPLLPDLSTNAEAGVPGLESDTLTGIVAPAGTPAALVDMWRSAIAKMVAEPDVKARLEALGFAPVANTPEEFGERIRVEVARWGQVVRDAHIRVD